MANENDAVTAPNQTVKGTAAIAPAERPDATPAGGANGGGHSADAIENPATAAGDAVSAALHSAAYSSARPQTTPSPAERPVGADVLPVLTLTASDHISITDLRDGQAVDQVSSAPIAFQSKADGGPSVAAQQLKADSTFHTEAGDQAMKEGDWIVTQAGGQRRLATAAEMQESYAPSPLKVEAPMQKYIKAMPIDAELITKPTQWHNPDAAPGAPPQIAQPGDYWAKPKGQEPYVIPGDYFRSVYVQIPGTGEYARTTITDAQILGKPAAVWSQNSGLTSGEAGDYLITRPNGSQEILSAKKFKDQFALAEGPSETREPLNKPQATGERFVLDKDNGVTAEPWAHGFILYDKTSITITDDRDASTKQYIGGRLVGEIKTTKTEAGQKVVTRNSPYGDLEEVRALPSLDSYKDLLERRPDLKHAQELANTMPMTDKINTPERNALRDKIGQGIRAEMASLRETPTADGSGAMNLEQGHNLHIVLGLSGSGKSTIANKIAEVNHAFIPDVDNVKPKLPEWQGGIGAAALSEEAYTVMNPIIDESIARGDNLVVPYVGASTAHIEALIEKAKANGYQVHLSLVDVPPTEAMKRIVGRMERGGLYASPAYLASLGNRPVQNFKGLVDKYMDSGVLTSFHQINNLGTRPVLVAEGHISGAPNTSGLPDDFFAAGNLTHKPAAGEEAVWRPGDNFRDSQTAEVAQQATRLTAATDAIPAEVRESMAVPEGDRSAEQRRALEDYMTQVGLSPEQGRALELKVEGAVQRGVPLVVAISTVFAYTDRYLQSARSEAQQPTTYH